MLARIHSSVGFGVLFSSHHTHTLLHYSRFSFQTHFDFDWNTYSIQYNVLVRMSVFWLILLVLNGIISHGRSLTIDLQNLYSILCIIKYAPDFDDEANSERESWKLPCGKYYQSMYINRKYLCEWNMPLHWLFE
jgi:hypothetical protein